MTNIGGMGVPAVTAVHSLSTTPGHKAGALASRTRAQFEGLVECPTKNMDGRDRMRLGTSSG